MRASAPAGPFEKLDDATPVLEVMYPSLIVVGDTPGALALLVPALPVAEPALPVLDPELPVLPVDEP